MYGLASCTQRSGRAGAARCADGSYLVRGFSKPSRRRQRCGICPLAPATRYGTDPVGAGPSVPQRGRASCIGGNACGSSCDHGGFVARRRCALGDGRRVALSQSGCRHWRDLGRPAQPGFHRDQAFGIARRGGGCVLLVDPQGGQSGPECRARTLAYRQHAIRITSPRPSGPRCATLVARSVSCAPYQTRPMGGHL